MGLTYFRNCVSHQPIRKSLSSHIRLALIFPTVNTSIFIFIYALFEISESNMYLLISFELTFLATKFCYKHIT